MFVEVSNFFSLSAKVIAEEIAMADTIENMTGAVESVELTPEDSQEISTEDFKQGFGEDLQKTLNLDT